MNSERINRVLVIDDEPDCTMLLSELIREGIEHVELKAANSGKEGWAIVQEWQPHVVLSDINMPGMDGLSLLEQIRISYPAMHSILFTARCDSQTPIKALKLGAADYLQKPIDGDEVIAAIRKTLKCREEEDDHRNYQQHLEHMVDESMVKLEEINDFLRSEINTPDSTRQGSEKMYTVSSEEKNLLIQEVNHRVKNNMQILISLLHMQSKVVKDDKALALIKQFQNRIYSMALIYDRLLVSSDLLHIGFKDYITSLAASLEKTHKSSSRNVHIKLSIQDVELGIPCAIPCGLIINELLSNALRHAFPEEKEGIIRICFEKKGENLSLLISDDGIGLPAGFDMRSTESIGLQLVTVLAEEQLAGTLECGRRGGTEFRITFKEPLYHGKLPSLTLALTER